MDIKPIILGLLFVVLLYVLFNPPASGSGSKHNDHGGKGGHGDKAGGKGAPRKH